MKNLLSNFAVSVALVCASCSVASAGVIFSENMGTTTANGSGAVSVNSGTYVWQRAGMQGPTVAFSGTVGVGQAGTQTGTNDSAGGVFGARGRSVRLNNHQFFQIGNVDTTGFTTYDFSFLAFRRSGITAPSNLTLDFSTDGTNWTSLWNGGALATGWNSITLSNISLALSTTSRFRWTNTGTVDYFRVDDAVLTGVTAVPEPTSMALAGLGLGAIAFGAANRRRRI